MSLLNPVYVPRSRKALSDTERGKKVTIFEIDGGRMLRGRLAELGLYPGETVTVVHNNGGGVIVEHRDCKFALGRGVSSKVRVQ
ncbi:MAG: ferrous iron transport protein A [Candidatus Thermoplasmatota archaeon]|nr:ferrous iron transport protein A [Candidatus Thermoplasmatota archaeon]